MITYKIFTPRLVIRCYDPDKDDAQLLQQSVNESLEHLKPWMPWAWYEPETLGAKRERVKRFKKDFDEGIDYIVGVFNSAETVLIGSSGLHTRIGNNAREIGYWVNINYANQGYATEIVTALVYTAFEIEKLGRLEIKCDPQNKASARIAEKCGFILKEILIANAKDVYGKDRDTMIWEITAQNYISTALRNFRVKAFDKTGNEIV